MIILEPRGISTKSLCISIATKINQPPVALGWKIHQILDSTSGPDGKKYNAAKVEKKKEATPQSSNTFHWNTSATSFMGQKKQNRTQRCLAQPSVLAVTSHTRAEEMLKFPNWRHKPEFSSEFLRAEDDVEEGVFLGGFFAAKKKCSVPQESFAKTAARRLREPHVNYASLLTP